MRDLPGTLRNIHALLDAKSLFISKTPCVGEMNPLIRLAVPVMRAIGKAPYAGIFGMAELTAFVSEAGFDVLASEIHATNRNDSRPYIVARKR